MQHQKRATTRRDNHVLHTALVSPAEVPIYSIRTNTKAQIEFRNLSEWKLRHRSKRIKEDSSLFPSKPLRTYLFLDLFKPISMSTIRWLATGHIKKGQRGGRKGGRKEKKRRRRNCSIFSTFVSRFTKNRGKLAKVMQIVISDRGSVNKVSVIAFLVTQYYSLNALAPFLPSWKYTNTTPPKHVKCFGTCNNYKCVVQCTSSLTLMYQMHDVHVAFELSFEVVATNKKNLKNSQPSKFWFMPIFTNPEVIPWFLPFILFSISSQIRRIITTYLSDQAPPHWRYWVDQALHTSKAVKIGTWGPKERQIKDLLGTIRDQNGDI